MNEREWFIKYYCEPKVGKRDLHAINHGSNLHKIYKDQFMSYYEMAKRLLGESDMIEEIIETKMTKKEAIGYLIDFAVIIEELMEENLKLSEEVVGKDIMIDGSRKQIHEIGIKHEAFVAGLNHGFKIESGDV